MNITILYGHMAKERHTLIYELAEDLSKKHNVRIISGYPSRRISSEVRKYYQKNPVEIVNDNFQITRVGLKIGEGKSLFTRAILYFLLTMSIYSSARKTKSDILYIYSSPPFLGLLAKKLSKICPVVYNAQDIFPDSLIALKNYKETSLLIKLLRKMELRTYQYSTKIITISEEMANTIRSRILDSSKVVVIRNWVDIDKLQPVERNMNKLFDIFNFDRNKFYISYGGDIGLFQNWEFTIDVMDRLKEYCDVVFVFFGNGSYENTLKKILQAKKINNCFILPFQSKEYVSSVYSFGDLELVSLRKNMTKFALPSKISQIFSTGRPVLGFFDYHSNIAFEINNNELGFSPKENDIEGTLDFILNYFNNTSIRFDSNNIRKYAEKEFNRNIQTEKYGLVFQYLMGDKI